MSTQYNHEQAANSLGKYNQGALVVGGYKNKAVELLEFEIDSKNIFLDSLSCTMAKIFEHASNTNFERHFSYHFLHKTLLKIQKRLLLS